jgi:hypothetical protein
MKKRLTLTGVFTIFYRKGHGFSSAVTDAADHFAASDFRRPERHP